MLKRDDVQNKDAVRLVMLYALRYERHTNNDIASLTQALARRGVSESDRRVSLVKEANNCN